MKHILFLDLDTYDIDLENEARILCAKSPCQIVLFGETIKFTSKKELKQRVPVELQEHLHPDVSVVQQFDNWANVLTWAADHLCEDFSILTNDPVGFDTGPSYIQERILCPAH